MMRLLLWMIIVLKIWTTCVCYQSLLFATSHDIRIVNPAKPKKHQVVIADQQSIYGVDYCYDESLICWSDTGAEEINCASFNGTQTSNKTTYAKNGVPSAEGLACDWVTKKLYWTDSYTKRIEVVSLKSKYRKVLFWQDLDQPRGIAVDPFAGLMFWTDWGEIPKIERASMDGALASRKVIISEHVFWPNSITLDIVDKKMYWIDAHLLKIEVTDYNGRNRTTLLNKELTYPFALTRIQDVLYWTDWKDISLHSYNFSYGGRPHEILHLPHDSPMDIEALGQSQQPAKVTPCDINNGGCSHLCLLSSAQPWYSCACPTGIKFVNDTNCANGIDHFLLLVQRVEISKISLDTLDYTNFKIPLKGVKRAMTIDYDPVENYFYWSDEDLKNIRRAKLDGSMQEDVVTKDVFNLDGIAIDWIARNMYWSNFVANRIETMRLNTHYRKTIIIEDCDSPRAIAVAPQHGWMFWSDWSENYPKIERTELDGTNRLVIVKDRIKWPNGLALDMDNGKLYWADAYLDTIEVANIDGKERREIISENLSHVFGFTLLGDYIYWTDWQSRTLERVNKNGQERQQLLEQLHDVMGVKAIDRNAKLGTNACAVNNGGCDQFCFFRVNKRVVCSCQIEYELGADNKSCVIPDAFLIVYNVAHLRRVSIQSNSTDVIPVTNIKSISAIDVDINDSRLYWADNKGKCISRAFLNGSHNEKIVEFGINSPESLAIDWLSSNLYWADTGSKRIEVTNLNGYYRKVLFWKSLKEPRNLVLDPRVGYMFWSEWDGQIGGIFKASMDGSSRILFISDIGRINGLTIDYAQRSLYWTQYKNDVASIEFCDAKGKNRRQIFNSKAYKPMSITQHQDYLYWVNFKNTSIIRANKFSGADTKAMYSQGSEISDLRIVHSSKQSGWNMCTNGSRDCKNLCLVKPGLADPSTDRICACPTHYTMRDGNCYAPENFLLYSLKNALFRLMPTNDECPDVALPVPGMKAVRAIEYDPLTKYVYWIDGKAQAIKRSFENGSHSVVIVSGTQNSKSIHFYDIALEPFNKLLFWSCSVSDSINVTRLNNSSLGHVFKATSGEKPRNIAVHPEKALLFWTDVGSLPRIMRSQLDGQGRIHIETDGQNVEAIAVDRELDKLFFTYGQEIFSSDLAGKRKTLLKSIYSKKIASLAVIDSFLYYWVDYKEIPACIERIDKLTGQGTSTVAHNVQATDLITVKSLDENALLNHPCSSSYHHANCSYLCVRSSANPNRANCSCPIGMKLNEDEKSCSNPPPCGKEHFMCGQPTGECIPAQWRCDGATDCLDDSDEMNCPNCVNEFKCRSGECVKTNAVCDGIPNCSDHSDEMNCCAGEFLSLRAPYFRCVSDDKCIPRSVVCDDWMHCSDGSDEMNCIGKSDIKTDNYIDNGSNVYVSIASILIVAFFATLAYFVFRCKKRLKRSNHEQDAAVLRPLAPNCATINHSIMNGGGGGSSMCSYDRSHITGASSSTSMNNCPLNPPPSPATTLLREECCCSHYTPPHPTPCSTDVCDESDTNYRTDSDIYVFNRGSDNGSVKYCRGADRYQRHRHDRVYRHRDKRYLDYGDDVARSMYKMDYDLCQPPPTPRSNSSDPPSPSSSTYFKPLPQPPPPSPTL